MNIIILNGFQLFRDLKIVSIGILLQIGHFYWIKIIKLRHQTPDSKTVLWSTVKEVFEQKW